MLKAVIFDFGGVVIKYSGERFRRDLSSFLKVNRNEINSAYKKIMPELRRGKIAEKEFWKRFSRYLGKDIEKEKWKDYFRKYFYKKVSINKKIVNLAKSLKKANYKIAVLSNTIKPYVKCTEEKGWYKIFPIKVLSCEVGFVKPDKEIYLLVLKKLKLRPEEAVFIDNKKEFVDAAKKLGINTVLFRNVTQLKKDLSKCGVNGI